MRSKPTSRAVSTTVLLVGLALASTACGESSSGPGVASASASSSAGRGTTDVLAYAQCMRSHGITEFPDPGADGSITIPPGLGLDPNSDRFKAAATACESLAPAGGNAPGPKRVDEKEMRKYLEFAKCVRGHGIANYPDPTTKDDGSLVFGLPKDIDSNTPQFKAAQEACESLLPDGAQPPAAGS